MKQKIGELTYVGPNVYVDSYGKTLIADRKNNRAYIVDKNDKNKFETIRNRKTIVMVIFLLLGFYWAWIPSLIISAILLVVVEGLYYYVYLPKLDTIDDVKFPEKESFMHKALNLSQGRRYMIIGIGILFFGLMLYNTIHEVDDFSAIFNFTPETNNDLMLVIATIGLNSYVLYVVVVMIIASFSPDRNKNMVNMEDYK